MDKKIQPDETIPVRDANDENAAAITKKPFGKRTITMLAIIFALAAIIAVFALCVVGDNGAASLSCVLAIAGIYIIIHNADLLLKERAPSLVFMPYYALFYEISCVAWFYTGALAMDGGHPLFILVAIGCFAATIAVNIVGIIMALSSLKKDCTTITTLMSCFAVTLPILAVLILILLYSMGVIIIVLM